MSRAKARTDRISADNYITPLGVVRGLIPFMPTESLGRVLDPCAGGGVFRRGLVRYSATWTDMDIRSTGLPGLWVTDFLYTSFDAKAFDTIISNPPYSLAQEFVENAISMHPRRVVFLLRLNFLGSRKRWSFWHRFPPTQVLTVVPRPSFTGGGSDATEYAFFVWGEPLPSYQNYRSLGWLSWDRE